jgi:lipid-binding SYLF domain-containing protein
MKSRLFAPLLALLLALCAGAALADKDKAAHQEQLRKAADATLQKFYQSQPQLEAEVKASPGYAVFTTYGVTFLLGGAGGGGTAHDKDGKVTYMTMAQASAGPQVGIGSKEMLLVFKTPEAYKDFVDKGWDVNAAGAVSMGAGKHQAGGGAGDQFVNNATVYTYSKNGIEVGATVAGTKFWKDKELN